MTAALGVQASEVACRSGDIAGVIASLPVSLRPDASGTELVGIDGGSGWGTAALAAVNEGVRGIVVVDPVAEEVADLRRTAQGHGIPIVIDRPFAGNPAVPGMVEYFSTTGGPHALLECTVTARVGGDLERVLMDQLALVGALAHQVESARALDWTSRRYVVTGLTADGRRVRLTGICTDARPPTAAVRLLGGDAAVELTLPSPVTARPGRSLVTTSNGAKLLPTLFETAHRLSWRRLARLVHDGEQAEDLTLFAHDSSIATAVIGGLPER